MKERFHFTILIDWGTENIRWTLDGEIHSIPNIVAFSKHSPDPVAVGEAALPVLKTQPELTKVTPPPGILFADADAITALLLEILARACALVPWRRRLLKPWVLASVPLGCSKLEASGFAHALKMEVQSVVLCETPMAAALGAGYVAETQTPFGILELGAGNMQFAMMKEGGLFHPVSHRRGGRDLDAALRRYLKKQYHVEATDPDLSNVKDDWNRHETHRIGGVILSRDELWSVYAGVLTPFTEDIVEEFLRMDVSLRDHLHKDGLILTGGLARMPGLPEKLSELLECPVHSAQAPENAVCRGLLALSKEIFVNTAARRAARCR